MGSSIWNWISCLNMTSCNRSDRKFTVGVYKTTRPWAYIICYFYELLW
jgi:hypothetical protein